jgi:hypothetical protein
VRERWMRELNYDEGEEEVREKMMRGSGESMKLK